MREAFKYKNIYTLYEWAHGTPRHFDKEKISLLRFFDFPGLVLFSDISDFGDELVADLCELVVVAGLLLDRPLQGVDPHLSLPQESLHLGDLGLPRLLDGVQALVCPAKIGTLSLSRFRNVKVARGGCILLTLPVSTPRVT